MSRWTVLMALNRQVSALIVFSEVAVAVAVAVSAKVSCPFFVKACPA